MYTGSMHFFIGKIEDTLAGPEKGRIRVYMMYTKNTIRQAKRGAGE